ncbi:hypothetical protein Pint_04305 [Pistacia integerrima]|uniref:Uncharacterized protein n=1 Tax=Pistacia integerrima TaxID=434235 RepID=A0ACC0Z234_9ROSI|nr:hypothetical protein Pint_04305 [Pistacia integerrima]
MASNILKLHIQTFKTSSPSSPVRQTKTHLPSLPFALNHHYHSHISSLPSTLSCKLQVPALSLQSSLSLSTPPTTKEEAILQAKTCLSTTLEKPLNNPKLAGKLKKLKQPRYRIEIPIIDDSPFSLSQLALDVFKDLPVRRKEESQLAVIRTVSDSFYPKPVVIFNPRWAFEEEDDFGDLTGFVGSFDVIYSFMGLEVKGILSKRKGVIFKCVRDGVLSGERWNVLVEEEGELKVVSKFKVRPSIGEVETVLYNLMAINSPITKSAKFLKDLVSNVTGKK